MVRSIFGWEFFIHLQTYLNFWFNALSNRSNFGSGSAGSAFRKGSNKSIVSFFILKIFCVLAKLSLKVILRFQVLCRRARQNCLSALLWQRWKLKSHFFSQQSPFSSEIVAFEATRASFKEETRRAERDHYEGVFPMDDHKVRCHGEP